MTANHTALADDVLRALGSLTTGGTIVCSYCNASDATDDGHRDGCPVLPVIAALDSLVTALTTLQRKWEKTAEDPTSRAALLERAEAAERRAQEAERTAHDLGRILDTLKGDLGGETAIEECVNAYIAAHVALGEGYSCDVVDQARAADRAALTLRSVALCFTVDGTPEERLRAIEEMLADAALPSVDVGGAGRAQSGASQGRAMTDTSAEEGIERLSTALRWYADEARAIDRYMRARPVQVEGITASATALGLDAGARADAALREYASDDYDGSVGSAVA